MCARRSQWRRTTCVRGVLTRPRAGPAQGWLGRGARAGSTRRRARTTPSTLSIRCAPRWTPVLVGYAASLTRTGWTRCAPRWAPGHPPCVLCGRGPLVPRLLLPHRSPRQALQTVDAFAYNEVRRAAPCGAQGVVAEGGTWSQDEGSIDLDSRRTVVRVPELADGVCSGRCAAVRSRFTSIVLTAGARCCRVACPMA